MKNLNSDSSYVFKLADGIIYAREIGEPHHKQFEIDRIMKGLMKI